MPWSKATHMLGKDVRRPDLGIVALHNNEGAIVAGSARDQVVLDYMLKMWGTPIEDSTARFNAQLLSRRAPKEACDSLLNLPIADKEVEECVKELKNGAPGDDMIPNSVWRQLSTGAIHNMAIMFEKHRIKCKFPNSWKYSDVKWIFKKGDPLDIINYRPIAFLSYVHGH